MDNLQVSFNIQKNINMDIQELDYHRIRHKFEGSSDSLIGVIEKMLVSSLLSRIPTGRTNKALPEKKRKKKASKTFGKRKK